MSLDDAKSFVYRMRDDKEFKAKVNSYPTKEAAHEFISQTGYIFTFDEVKEAMQEFKECNKCVELSDEQLDMISGGRQCHTSASCHLPRLCSKCRFTSNGLPVCPVFLPQPGEDGFTSNLQAHEK
ncbi:MAG: Nif11-like leader peptide family RiPP precursor [Desulfobacteraceae bacterium]|jgi:predicted ribosomally synthesized peptide with nif11-like leader